MFSKKLFLASLVAVSISQGAFASKDRGGGDQCKNEIDKDRIAISNWIQTDRAKDLNFNLAWVKDWTYNNSFPAKSYKQSMLAALQEGKVVVTCYLDPARITDPAARKIAESEGVGYKSITIGTPAKPTTCVNYEDGAGISHIDCNYDLVMNPNSIGNPDFVTVHHEFASIAGVEARTDSFVSDFSVSNQLSQFEHWQLTKVLGPKNPAMSVEPPDAIFLGVRDRFEKGHAPTEADLSRQWFCYSHHFLEGINDHSSAIDDQGHRFEKLAYYYKELHGREDWSNSALAEVNGGLEGKKESSDGASRNAEYLSLRVSAGGDLIFEISDAQYVTPYSNDSRRSGILSIGFSGSRDVSAYLECPANNSTKGNL